MLLFGVLITAAVGWQVGVVPQQNERVEFNHVQEVQSQMQELGATVGSMGSGSGTKQVGVSLGNRFPDRTLFVNPPPTGGRLRTVGSGADGFATNVTNATAVDEEENDYWTGANRSFSTAAFVYDPALQAYDGGPERIVYENSLVYSRYGSFWRQHADQGLVNGRDISLVTVNGSYSKASSGEVAPTDLQLYPASASPTTVRVRNDSGGPIQIRVPTNLDQATWKDRLAGELSGAPDDDAYVKNVSVKPANIGPEDWDLLVLTLEGNETYDLQLSKVRVGSAPEAGEPPAYVTVVDGRTATVRESSDHRVTFEVRDRFDNPVSNATVNVSLDGPGELSADGASKRTFTNLRTDPDGEVTLTYAVDDVDGDQDVSVRVNRSGSSSFGGNQASTAFVNFTVADGESSDDSNSGIGGGTYTVAWPSPGEIAGRSGKLSIEDGNLTVDRGSVSVVQLNATTDGLSGALVEFSVSDQRVLTVKNATSRSNDAAVGSVNLTVNQRGWAYVYVTGGGTGDRIRIVVEDADPTRVGYITAVEPNPDALDDSDGEFIAVNVSEVRDTSDWVVRDDESGVGSAAANLPANADVVWFVRNETAFRDQWVVPSDVTLVEFQPGGNGVLANGGEPLELVNTTSGRVVDEFAYGSASTSNGWSFTFSGGTAGKVAVRDTYANGTPVDNDEPGDWSATDEGSYFTPRFVTDLSLSPDPATTQTAVTVDASGSTDRSASIERYVFDLGEGYVVNTTSSSIEYVFDCAGTRTVEVTTISTDGERRSTTATVEVDPEPRTVVATLNAGGDTYTSCEGVTYDDADGSSISRVDGGSQTYETADTVNGTVDDTLYQTEAYSAGSSLEYEVAVPDGEYRVTLKFAEIYDPISPSNPRVFDVALEGTTRRNDLSIHDEVGPDTRLDLTYNVTVTDGTLDIDLPYEGPQNPKVGAIMIERLNGHPEPEFTATPSDPTTLEDVAFDASATTDPDGDALTYEWDFGDGTTGTGETVSHGYDDAGTYTVMLSVTDAAGVTNTTTRTVTVDEPGVGIHDDFEGGRSLDANGNWSRVNAPSGEVFVATGTTVSNSPTRAVHIADVSTNGGIVSTVLDTSGRPSVNVTLAVKQGEPGGDPPESGEALLVQYRASDGTWTTVQTIAATGSNEPYQQVSATLTDPNALHSNFAVRIVQTSTTYDDSWFVDDICVSAGAHNCQPTANVSFSPPSPYAGTLVTFDAADSVDVDGSITSYEWAFGDGTTAIGESVTHTYASTGTYQVTLTVTDDEGATSTTTRTVTVQSTSGTLYYVGDGVALEGGDNSGSIDTDPRGGIEFNLSNGHSQPVTLLEVTIDPLNDSIDGLSDKLGGANGQPEVNEIVVFADTGNGYVDYQLFDTEYQSVPAGGLVVDLDNSAGVNNGNPVMSSGSEARFYIYEFYDQSGPTNVNMTGEEVAITVTYRVQGGGTLTETFTMDLVAGPAAEAGPDTVVDEGSTTTLDGSASSSPGGSVTSYEWAVTRNPSDLPVSVTDADTSTPAATFDASGVDVTGNEEVEVTLTTTNARGRSSTDTVNVTVNDLDRSGLNYVSGSGSTNDEGTGSLSFTISNDDTSAVTVQNATVSVSGGPAGELEETAFGVAPGTVEVYVASPSGDGYREGTMTLGTTYQLDLSSQIGTGEDARVTLAYFRKNNGDAVNVAGSTVTVTLGLSDGRTITVVIDDI
ncbi:PKD domain-containing protein [Halorubellus salinus]|uniref:PKD domain-containing protein n=1 Tax=Halorubellus salinus TaxID=755309 RepID=UPI001D05F3BF